MGKTVCISCRKGGVGKTTTAVSLAAGLAKQNKKTLLIDLDPQHSATVSLGMKSPDKLTATLGSAMTSIINEVDFEPTEGIIRTESGVDLLPANDTLTVVELALNQVLGRESILRQYIDLIRERYDYIVLDTTPSLGLLTVNALAATDSVIIPVAPKFLDAKGLELLLKTVAQIKRQINPNLSISGILLTMVDKRTKLTQDIITLIESTYGEKIHIYPERIPRSVRAAETSAVGKSIFDHDPNGKVAEAYTALVREVLANG